VVAARGCGSDLAGLGRLLLLDLLLDLLEPEEVLPGAFVECLADVGDLLVQ